MAHGGPAADPQVSADLSTVRVWNRRILAGKLEWPLEPRLWDNARAKGAPVVSCVRKWPAPAKTLRAWLPVFLPLPTDNSSLMGRVRRRTPLCLPSW
eukprot:5747083-Amphidinium_carterae.1